VKMNMYWMSVFAATIFEVLWVIGLKHASSPLDWIGTASCVVVTFILLTYAGKKLPIGTTYTVFTGIGTVGTILSDTLFFGETLGVVKALLIALLLSGVIGLKMITKEHDVMVEKVHV